jgi:predicted RNA-binding Zn-ribbon protein involved in translation (DUF1610 family)
MADERQEQERQQQRYQNMQGQTAPQAAPLAEDEQKKKSAAVEGEGPRYCKYCELPLAVGQVFCPNCGEKHGGEENICPYCGQATTKKTCPKCQNQIIPNKCPKCGKSSLSPVCTCGEILDKKIKTIQAAQEQVDTQSAPAVRQMSAVEVQKIEELFRAEEEKPDFKKFQKRLLERQKGHEEEAYYNKMQKEIVEVFGERPFKIELPNPEEQATRMRLYASLEQSVIQKQRRATQEELEAKYPELRHVHEAENKAAEEKAAAEEAGRQKRMELAKRQREMEEKYRAILEGVNQEVAEEKERVLAEKRAEEERLQREREEAEARIREEAEERARKAAQEKAAAEARASEEAAQAQRQREMQEAQEQAWRRAYQNRILGTFYGENANEKFTIMIDSPTHASRDYRHITNQHHGVYYTQYKVIMKGNQITLTETARTILMDTNPGQWIVAPSFNGELNNNGTVLSGYWSWSGGKRLIPLTYYKVD